MDFLRKNIIRSRKWQILAISFVLLGFYRFYKKKRSIRQIQNKWDYYSNLAQQVIANRNQKIEQFLSKYSDTVSQEQQQFILNCSINELISEMNSMKITSEQIVITYSIRICQIGIKNNYIADIDFESAITQAQEKDKIRKDNQGKNLPPFHGLLIGIKDQLPIKGLLCTMGLISRAAKVQEQDCAYVATLRRLGVVFLCMTTCPQFSVNFTTESLLWGKATNPHNPDFSTGGSSGGSAATVASRCLPIAIGSDLGGSIRLPAAFCGVYSFKPSNLRVSKRGVMGVNLEGDLSSDRDAGTSLGPIGRNVDDLLLICQNTFGQFIEDPLKNTMSWNQQNYDNFNTKQLNIGYVDECQAFPLVAPVKNVIQEVIQELRNQGHNLIPFDFDQFFEIDIIAKKLSAGMNVCKMMENGLQGEKPIQQIANMLSFFKLPQFAKTQIAKKLQKTGNQWFSRRIETKFDIQYSDAIELQQQFDQWTYKFFDYWKSLKIDLLILPIAQFFTLKHQEGAVAGLPSYLFITNALKMPVGTIPIRLANEQEQFYDSENEKKNFNILKRDVNSTVKNCAGMPVSIQIAALPFEDEKCFKGLKMVEEIYKFNKLI